MSNNFIPSSEETMVCRLRLRLKKSVWARFEAEAKDKFSFLSPAKRLPAAMATFILEERYREAVKGGK